MFYNIALEHLLVVLSLSRRRFPVFKRKDYKLLMAFLLLNYNYVNYNILRDKETFMMTSKLEYDVIFIVYSLMS